MIAQLQHITYNEFVPLIVGKKIMEDFGLTISQKELPDKLLYDSSMNPTILNSFASAAYRLHSLIPSHFELRDNQDRTGNKND